MKIKKLTINNIDELYDLYVQQFKNEAWTLDQIKSSFNTNSTYFYGIYQENILASFISILVTVDDINILDVATHENFKRQGLAKQLITYVINMKTSEQSVSLEVKSKNIPAIKLYESFGFKTLHVRKKYYSDGDDALCMFLLTQ